MMKLIFMACAQSSAVDSQSGQLSLFHLVEQMQAAAFPTSVSLTVVGMFAKDLDDPDNQSVRLKVELDGASILDAPVNFSFAGKPRNRVVTVMKGLGIPGAGDLSFSFVTDAGVPLGAAWHVVAESAVSSASASPTA